MLDAEIKSLRAIVRALEPLPYSGKRRVIGYLHDALADNAQMTQPEQPPTDEA